jgi:hypothetical protein
LDFPNTTAEDAVSPSQLLTQTQSPSTTPDSISASAPPVISGWKFHKACASEEAKLLIASGDPSARTKCIDACQDGLCCFTTELRYDWLEPCNEGNEQMCAEYSPCLILQQDAADTRNDTAALDFNFTAPSTNDATSTLDEGTDALSASNETSLGNATIEPTVENATVDNEPDSSITDFGTTVNDLGNSANSSTTDNTLDVSTEVNVTNNVQTDGPPIPAQDLTSLCSNNAIQTVAGLKQCMNVCALGQCCAIDDESTCYPTHKEICNLYIPCNNAYHLLYS